MLSELFNRIDEALTRRMIGTNVEGTLATIEIEKTISFLKEKEIRPFVFYFDDKFEHDYGHEFRVISRSVCLEWDGKTILIDYDYQDSMKPLLGARKDERIYAVKHLLPAFLDHVVEIISKTAYWDKVAKQC